MPYRAQSLFTGPEPAREEHPLAAAGVIVALVVGRA
jgi:hypothetical protein